MGRKRLFATGEVVTFPVRMARWMPDQTYLGRIVGYRNSRYQVQAMARLIHSQSTSPFRYVWRTAIPARLQVPLAVRAKDLTRRSMDDVIALVREPNPNPRVIRNMRPTTVAAALFTAANVYRSALSLPLQDQQ